MESIGYTSVLFADISGVDLRAPRTRMPLHIEVSPQFYLHENQRLRFSRAVSSILELRNQFNVSVLDEHASENGIRKVGGSTLYLVHDALLKPIRTVDRTIKRYDEDRYEPRVDANATRFVPATLQRVTHLGLGQLIDGDWRVTASYPLGVPNYDSGARMAK